MKYILPILLSLFIFHKTIAQDYVPGLLVVKFKEGDESARIQSSNSIDIENLRTDQKVLKIQSFESKSQSGFRTTEKSRLDNLFKIEIGQNISEESYINYLNSFDNIEYVERYPNVKPLYVPNDPEAQFGRAQFHLNQINVYDAWNVTQGDEDIVIGIIDTGADLDHEDLEGNLYLNTADPIDGIDNDNDGYIDNYYGWDFADNDNSPEADGSAHGTGVAGIAAAATDNNTGIAGIGFNTKFMPIKIFKTQDNFSRNSYEAIIYAADKGCDIINLSWGSTGRYSQFAQDIINYAVLEKDVVIVAAAGNTNAELDFFPASYDNVLSVGYVNADDSRNSNATYSDFIDLVAPGIGVYTTENDDTYGTDSGSSYAAPMVAGAAALLRAVFPDWSAQQVMEQLRVSSDDINDIANNSNFQYKFGKGRLNVFKSLADYDKPSIRISEVSFTNGLEEAAYFGDTLDITVEFTNFLELTENIAVELTSSSPYVNILQANFNIKSLDTFEKTSNQNNVFKVVLSENLPENTALNFRILMSGERYKDYQSFQIQSSSKIRLFQFNEWDFGFTATGNFGRSADTPFDNYAVRNKGKKLIDHMGLILYLGEDSLERNTLINPNSFQYIDDFQSFQSLKRYDDITADFDVRSIFTEKEDISNPLGIYIHQKLLAWSEEQNFFIHQYKIENRSVNNYDSVYFALFTDYALGDKVNNSLKYDSALQLSYAYDESENEFVGLSLLTTQDSIFYAFDLGSENGHISDLENDSLNNIILKNAFKNPFSEKSAGDLSGGNNVGSLHGVRLSEFASSSSQNLSFAVLRADNLAALKALVLKAKAKDSLSAAMPPFGQQIFICENDSPILSAPQNSEYKVYGDATVDTVLYSGSNFEIGEIQNDTTFYVEIVDSIGITGERKRFVFSIQQPTADFSVASDTLLINTDEVNTFQFMDESEFASAWNWEFSNGITSSKQNPTIIVDEVGEFTAKLIITSNIGCQDTVSKTFQVYERAHRPKINDVELCRNEDLIISTPELNEITIYTDSLMQNQIFKGTEFTVGNLTTDTSFYIRNEVGDFPSTLIEFKAKIIPIKAKMDVIVDFSSENQELRGIARSNSEFANENIWLIDNDTIGTGNEIYFDLLKLKSGTLKLISISESNCMDSVSFDSSISKVPEFDNYYLCQNQDLILSSLNTEDLFYFEDKELTQFIGKGSRVEMREIDKNMSLFAVNVQNIHPSNVVEVPIYVSSLTADFNISHDTINLAYETDLQLESLSESATKWNWEINNQSIGQNKSVSHRLREAGVFEVQLTVSDTLGCTEILEKKLVVFNDPLLGNQKELRSYFSIFPNPANNFVHLTAKSQFKFDGYSVVDTKGKEVLKAKNDMPSLQTEIIDVSELKQGAYYLIIRKGKQEASFLFVISR